MTAYASSSSIAGKVLSHAYSKFLGLPTENETTEDDESIDEETGSVAMKEEGDLDEDGDELAVISRAEAEHVGKPQTTRPSQMQQATNDVSATAANFNEPVVDQAMSHGEFYSAMLVSLADSEQII